MSGAVEMNFDAIVGPTHHYGGLAHDNRASQHHAGRSSNPRAAALEGLAKMKLLMDLGVPQAVLPPPVRPDTAALRRLGFSGSDARVLAQAHKDAPALLEACSSASAMWAANAATVSPAADTADHRLHLTPANRIHQFHRALEAPHTAVVLQAIFPEGEHFSHHPPLPAALALCDEGAANHTRLAPSFDAPGLEIFIFGRRGMERSITPGRQTFESSQAIARLHGLTPARTMFIPQHPEAIAAGVFHNDVISVGHLNVLLCHEHAYANGRAAIDEIRARYAAVCEDELHVVCAAQDEVPLADAVATYVFNSQIVSTGDNEMALIAPAQCAQVACVRAFMDRVVNESPIRRVHFVDVRQSMNNGGGPACLRLRVVLIPAQRDAIHPGVILTPALYDRLVEWVARHYRTHLIPADLADPELLKEAYEADAELATVLRLPTT